MKMKLTLFCAFLMASMSVLADAPRQVIVTNTSVTIISARIPMGYYAPSWSNGVTYSQGAYFTSSNMIYMVMSSTNTSVILNEGPHHGSGTVTTNGVAFYRVPPYKRLGYGIYNSSTGHVWVSIGPDPAVATNGLHIGPAAGKSSFDIGDALLQNEVRVISDPTGTNVLTIQEW